MDAFRLCFVTCFGTRRVVCGYIDSIACSFTTVIPLTLCQNECLIFECWGFSIWERKEDVGMTTRHLHRRIVEHKHSIGNHFREHHGNLLGLKSSQFHVLKKCRSKFNCLVYEILFIQKLKPSLNVQSDSINAKRFIELLLFSILFYFYSDTYFLLHISSYCLLIIYIPV